MVTRKESEKISNLEIDVKVIMEKVETIENNHLAHMKKDIDRILYSLGAIGLLVIGQLLYIISK